MNTRRFLLAFIGLSTLWLAARSTPAADPAPNSRMVAELLWGTDAEKPAGKDFKPVAAEIERKLRKIFKWKHYFSIERKVFEVAAAKPAKVEMSKDCRIEISALPDAEFEIQLFGKGKLVVKKRQRIQPGETVLLGGDDKNDESWWVVVALAKPGEPLK